VSEDKSKFKTLFEALASNRGYTPRKRNNSDKDCKNVSHILTGKGKEGKPIKIKVDVKKIKNKKQDQNWLWIEFKNASGRDGWVHGDAHFVVFERKEDFIFINRKELLSWISSSNKIRYDLPFVSLAKNAKYRVYKRSDKKDQITQIKVDDIKSLKSFQIWKKEDAASN
jgi:hypothetical protein